MKSVADVLRPDAEVILVVPPFLFHNRPALGVHILQAIARREGFEAQVLYTNLLFAAFFDEGTHTTLSRMQHDLFLGERLFARAAFGTPALGRDGGEGIAPTFAALEEAFRRGGVRSTFTMAAIRSLEARIPAFLETIVPAIAGRRIVGCTTSFEQTSASIAILEGVKRARPATIAIIGGANCEAVMAEGICSLSALVDHVFSGESERAFSDFLGRVRRDEPSPRIVAGEPCADLDAVPTPDFADYYAQLEAFLPASPTNRKKLVSLIYETSRGCWWGEKSHCTFCGLNGEGMASREKSPARVLEELEALVARHPVADARGTPQLDAAGARQGLRDEALKYVLMTDNIMPHSYFRTLLPALEGRLPGVTLWYEQKANLSLAQVRKLVRAGVREIQPGIEALSTDLLRRMAKGTTTAQNVALLRYARATGMTLYWNLLVGFPGDEAAAYEETLEILPLLHHLQPPVHPCPVVIDRFSPYFDHPERYGITDLRPVPLYRAVFPETAAVEKIAYHFEGTYRTAARERPELVARMGAEIERWRARHYGASPPELRVTRERGEYAIVDGRGLGVGPERERIDEARAAAALVQGRATRADDATAWALARRAAIVRDGKIVPLAIADPDLLEELEARHRRPSAALAALAG